VDRVKKLQWPFLPSDSSTINSLLRIVMTMHDAGEIELRPALTQALPRNVRDVRNELGRSLSGHTVDPLVREGGACLEPPNSNGAQSSRAHASTTEAEHLPTAPSPRKASPNKKEKRA
jgi:hypothetical protein